MAIIFNGTTTKIVAAKVAPTNFTFNQPFSVSGWAYMVDVSYNSLVGHLDPGSGYKGWEITRSSNGSGVLEFFVVNSYSATTLQNSTASSTWTSALNNKWTQFGVTYDGQGFDAGSHLYINGLEPSRVIVSNTLGTNSTSNTIPLRIGQRIDGSIPMANGARLADIGIWNVVLTPGEMAALSLGTRANFIRPSALVTYYPLTGRVANYEPDSSPYQNDGTATAIKFVPDPPFLADRNKILVTIPAEGEMPIVSVVGPSFISGWSRQSNLPVIGGGTF